jgi:hypothetical protein
VNAGYYHRVYKDLHITDRQQITYADFTSFTTPMPYFGNDPTLEGVLDPNEILTVYNLNKEKQSVYDQSQVDFNSTGAFSPNGNTANTAWYNGIDAGISARFQKATVSFSWTMEHFIQRYCDHNDDPNGVIGAGPGMGSLYQGTLVNGGRFCDQSQFSLPFQSEFKLLGSYQLPFGVDFGTVLQAYPGQERTITWNVPAGLFPGGRTKSETIPLTEPGSLYYPRWTQLDINFKKNWRLQNKQYSVQLDLFNVLNNNAIWTQNNSIGGSLGQVQTFLMGRLPRIAFQFKW